LGDLYPGIFIHVRLHEIPQNRRALSKFARWRQRVFLVFVEVYTLSECCVVVVIITCRETLARRETEGSAIYRICPAYLEKGLHYNSFLNI